MKLTTFLGSPRADGNTDIIALRVIDGARDAGLDTKTIALRKLNIRGCVGCSMCWKNGRKCAIDDDMTSLYDIISDSDVLLFATPVYWYAPTAIMKAFIDRFVVFNHAQGKPLIEGKSVVLVTAYEEEGPSAAELMLRMFDLSFDYLGVKLVGSIVADGLGPKGAALKKTDVLDSAYKLGLALGEIKR
ncbi:flavodoxin family protein [bacterium]|nr:flavodoxin family protein [bacterium]